MEWLTEAEVNTIIKVQKAVDKAVIWVPKKDTHIYTFNVPVIFPSDNDLIPMQISPLTLEGSYNARLGYITFKIMYAGTQRIKCLDIGRTHRNPDKEKIGKITRKHKHTWKDEHRDQWVYDPQDITPGAPAEQVFSEFLVECNIAYEGPFSIPIYQLELGL